MWVTRLKSERNLTELVDRLFNLDRSTAGRREIAAAIAEANPDLNLTRGSLTSRLDPGELIAVPEIPGAVMSRAPQPLSREAGRALLRESGHAMKALSEAVTADAEAARAAREATATTLDSAALKRAIRDDPQARERVKGIKRAVAERTKLVEDRVNTAEEVIAEAHKVIDRMLNRVV